MRSVLLVSFFVCGAAAVAAGDEAAGTNAPAKLKEMVVTSRADSMVRVAAAASEGAVGHEQLLERPIFRAGEVVETVPGVIVSQHAGGGKANQYYLRGFNLDHGTDFSTEINDVPWNLPTHAHGQGYTDLNPLIPELIDHVHFFKGPYAAEAGDFASAGGIRIDYVDYLPEALAILEGGNHGYARALLADSSRAGDAGHLTYAAEAYHNDGPWKRPDDYQKFNGFLRLVQGDMDRGYSATFMGYHGEWNSSDQLAKRAVDSGLVDRLGSLDDSTGGDSQRYVLAGEMHGGDWRNVTRVTGYVEYYDMDLFSDFTYFLDDPVNGDQFEQQDRRWIEGVRVSHEVLRNVAGLDTDSTIGLDLRNDDIRNGIFHTKDRERLGTAREDDVMQTSIAPYGKTKVKFNEWFRTEAGVRASFYRFDVDSRTDDANDGTETDSIVSPKLGLVFGPWAQTEFYVNGGLGFHSNDGRGTTTKDDPTTPEPNDGTPVDPLVQSKGAEVGVRTEAVPGLNSSVALWLLDIDSELLFVGDAGNTEAGRPSRRYGVEFANYYKHGRWLTIDGDLSLSHAEFRDDAPEGDHIPGAIETAANGGITLGSDTGAFGGVRVRYFGARPLIEDDSIRSDATTLVYLQTGYHINKTWTLTLDIFNLLDAKDDDIAYYYTSRLPGEPLEGIDDIHAHPAESRAFRMQLAARF